jgi:hypothetical protein
MQKLWLEVWNKNPILLLARCYSLLRFSFSLEVEFPAVLMLASLPPPPNACGRHFIRRDVSGFNSLKTIRDAAIGSRQARSLIASKILLVNNLAKIGDPVFFFVKH